MLVAYLKCLKKPTYARQRKQTINRKQKNSFLIIQHYADKYDAAIWNTCEKGKG